MKAHEGYKQCSKCKCVYPVSCFYNDKYASDGLSFVCRFCKSEYDKSIRMKRLDNGLCAVCGKNPIAFYRSFTKCEQCLEKHNRENNERRNKLVANGLCKWCGKQPIAYNRSSCLCEDCLNHKNYFEKYRNGYYPDLEKELEEVRKYMEEKRNESSRI